MLPWESINGLPARRREGDEDAVGVLVRFHLRAANTGTFFDLHTHRGNMT